VERVFGDALRFIIYNKCSRKGQSANVPNCSLEEGSRSDTARAVLLRLEASA
jgi:hypothetical protein